MMNPKIVGARIAELRKDKNMTQQQLADELLVSNKAVSKWENGGGLPDIATIPKLAEVLGVKTDYLLNENTDDTDKIKAKPRYKKFIVAICIIGILTISTIIALALNNQSESEWSDFVYLHEFVDVLAERGLQFINVSQIPHTTDFIDWSAPHIGRISEDIPIRLSTKKDIDLLLAIYKIVIDSQTAGLGWDTSIDEAINEAGLDDYLMEGIREIAKYEREKSLIFLATEHSFEELVEWGIFARPGIMKDFHALGFFLDLPEDFHTSIDDLNTNGFMVIQAYYIPWEMPWIRNGEIPDGIFPASPYNQELMVEVIDGDINVTVLGDINRPITYDIPLIIPGDIIPFNSDKRTVVTDGILVYVIYDDINHLTDGSIRLNRMIDIYDLSQVDIWYGTIRARFEGDLNNMNSSNFSFDYYVEKRIDFYELEVMGMELYNDATLAFMILSITLNTATNITYIIDINLGL